MTVKTEQRDGKFKRKHSNQHNSSALLDPSSFQRTTRPSEYLPPSLSRRQLARISTVTHYNVSPLPHPQNNHCNRTNNQEEEEEEEEEQWNEQVRDERVLDQGHRRKGEGE